MFIRWRLFPCRQDIIVFGLSLALRSALLVVLLLSGLHGQPYDTSSLIGLVDCDGTVPPQPGDLRLQPFFKRLGAEEHVQTVTILSSPCTHVRSPNDTEFRSDPAPTGGSHSSLLRLAVWDSVFFTRIASCGYEYEQFHAFFPLLPILLRAASFTGERHSMSRQGGAHEAVANTLRLYYANRNDVGVCPCRRLHWSASVQSGCCNPGWPAPQRPGLRCIMCTIVQVKACFSASSSLSMSLESASVSALR